MMNRREAIRLLAAGISLPLTTPGAFALLREARSVVGTGATLHTLNAHQEATVKVMAEMILPRTDTPGATDAGACEFIDLILTEWYDDNERGRFLKGLEDVDTHSQSLFGKDFAGCSAAQQAEILTMLGEKMTTETPVTRSPRPARGDWSSRSESFYSMLRRLTLTAYYTSEAGATGELHFEVIPDHFDSCAPIAKEAQKQP